MIMNILGRPCEVYDAVAIFGIHGAIILASIEAAPATARLMEAFRAAWTLVDVPAGAQQILWKALLSLIQTGCSCRGVECHGYLTDVEVKNRAAGPELDSRLGAITSGNPFPLILTPPPPTP